MQSKTHAISNAGEVENSRVIARIGENLGGAL